MPVNTSNFLSSASAAVTSGTIAVSATLFDVSWPVLLFASFIASIAALFGQLLNISEGLPGWKSFTASILGGAMAGFIVAAIALANNVDPHYTLAAVFTVGAMGAAGLELILSRARKMADVGGSSRYPPRHDHGPTRHDHGPPRRRS